MSLSWLRTESEEPELCSILNFKIMKKIVLFSFIMIASVLSTSCTADAIEDNIPNQAVNADGDTGGQTGVLKPPPPPPPPLP